MSNQTLIKNAKIVNEGSIFEGDILIENEIIKEVDTSISVKSADVKVIDAEGNYVFPGMIDDNIQPSKSSIKADRSKLSRIQMISYTCSYLKWVNM